MKIILWNMMTNILITPMLKNREQHFMVLFFYGIDMQRINVYHVVINFQVKCTKLINDYDIIDVLKKGVKSVKVELKIDPNCQEPWAVINVAKLTPSLQAAITILEKECEEMIFTAQNNGKIYIIDPVKIELIRTEGRELALYDLKKERYVLNKPLYEVQEQLGKDFVRISKFAIINIKRINHVEASFNGTMEIVMKNGLEEIITRSYRKLFKERLGV